MIPCRTVIGRTALTLSILALAACAGTKEVKMEVSREVVITDPEIESVELSPSGRLDTRESGQKVTVRMKGDPDLRATFDVVGSAEGVPMQETEPGVYVGSFDVAKGQTGALAVKGHLFHQPTGAHGEMTAAAGLDLYQSAPPAPVKRGCDQATAAAFDKALEPLKVRFEFNESKVGQKEKNRLTQNESILSSHPECVIEIHGHTDDVGSDDYNMELSRKRAESVEAYLKELGVPGKMVVKAFGKSRPEDPAKTDAARAKNRRVELHVSAQ